jgi:hypothetical protein
MAAPLRSSLLRSAWYERILQEEGIESLQSAAQNFSKGLKTAFGVGKPALAIVRITEWIRAGSISVGCWGEVIVIDCRTIAQRCSS